MEFHYENYGSVDSTTFQGYLSRPIQIELNGTFITVFPIGVDNEYLYCVPDGDGAQYKIKFRNINQVRCVPPPN